MYSIHFAVNRTRSTRVYPNRTGSKEPADITQPKSDKAHGRTYVRTVTNHSPLDFSQFRSYSPALNSSVDSSEPIYSTEYPPAVSPSCSGLVVGPPAYTNLGPTACNTSF